MIYIGLMWLWPISGIIIGIVFALWRTQGDNAAIRLIGICLGILAGIVLGPFTFSLFTEARARDEAGTK